MNSRAMAALLIASACLPYTADAQSPTPPPAAGAGVPVSNAATPGVAVLTQRIAAVTARVKAQPGFATLSAENQDKAVAAAVQDLLAGEAMTPAAIAEILASSVSSSAMTGNAALIVAAAASPSALQALVNNPTFQSAVASAGPGTSGTSATGAPAGNGALGPVAVAGVTATGLTTPSVLTSLSSFVASAGVQASVPSGANLAVTSSINTTGSNFEDQTTVPPVAPYDPCAGVRAGYC